MSMMRLLAAGKSLVGMKDHNSPYRVTRQKLLPKFGSKRNPFRAPTGEQPAFAPPSHGGQASAPTSEVPASSEAASPANSSAKSGQAIDSRPAVSDPARKGYLARLKARFSASVSARPGKTAPLSAPRADQAPVQGELSLDRVRVVRNDLSDEDLEIVPVRPRPTKSAPEPGSTSRDRLSLPVERNTGSSCRPEERLHELGLWSKALRQSILRKVGAMRS